MIDSYLWCSFFRLGYCILSYVYMFIQGRWIYKLISNYLIFFYFILIYFCMSNSSRIRRNLSYSIFSFVLTFLPDTNFSLAGSHKHAALAPRIIISKLSFISISIFEEHLTKSLHFTCFEFSHVLDPIYII